MTTRANTARRARTAPNQHASLRVWLRLLACANVVEPYTASTASPPSGPAGAPTTATTTGVGQTTATGNWTAGDATAQTEVSLAPQSTGSFSVVTTLAPGVHAYTFTGLSTSTAYEWRVRHVLNGQYSSYLGPVSGSEFTTAATTLLQPPTGIAVSELTLHSVSVTWTNSGESGVSTELWMNTSGGSYGLIQTVGVGSSSTTVTGLNSTLTYGFEVRHVRSGSDPSDFDGPVTIDMSTGL